MNILKIFHRQKDEEQPTLQLHKLWLLKGKGYPCDRCELEDKDCFKLHFHDRTVCVTPRENVISYCKKTKKL